MCVGRYGHNITTSPIGIIKYPHPHQSNVIYDRKYSSIKPEYGAVSHIF